jgi:hypothetical protein
VHTDKYRATKEYSVDAVKLINMAVLGTLLSVGDTSRQGGKLEVEITPSTNKYKLKFRKTFFFICI